MSSNISTLISLTSFQSWSKSQVAERSFAATECRVLFGWLDGRTVGESVWDAIVLFCISIEMISDEHLFYSAIFITPKLSPMRMTSLILLSVVFVYEHIFITQFNFDALVH